MDYRIPPGDNMAVTNLYEQIKQRTIHVQESESEVLQEFHRKPQKQVSEFRLALADNKNREQASAYIVNRIKRLSETLIPHIERIGVAFLDTEYSEFDIIFPICERNKFPFNPSKLPYSCELLLNPSCFVHYAIQDQANKIQQIAKLFPNTYYYCRCLTHDGDILHIFGHNCETHDHALTSKCFRMIDEKVSPECIIVCKLDDVTSILKDKMHGYAIERFYHYLEC